MMHSNRQLAVVLHVYDIYTFDILPSNPCSTDPNFRAEPPAVAVCRADETFLVQAYFSLHGQLHPLSVMTLSPATAV